MVVDTAFGAGAFVGGLTGFEDVQAHYIARGVVKRERQKVEVDHGMQTFGKVVEKRGQIALLRDGFADFQQGFELAPGMIDRRGRAPVPAGK